MVTSSQVDEVHLQLADHFSPSVIRHRSVWTARHRTPSFVATLFNLGVLLGGIDRLNKYKPPGLSSYSFSFGVGPQCSPEDMGNGDAKDACEQLIQQVHFGTHDYDLQIERAGSFYYYAALTTVAAWLTLDLARWCGRSSAILDYLLGFRSAARERARYRAFLLLLLPYLHLLLLYCLPLTAGCCRATLNPAAVLERARTLAFLLFLTGFCLLGDSHNHGYLLLRVSDEARAAQVLLRADLARRHTSRTNPPAERETDNLRRL